MIIFFKTWVFKLGQHQQTLIPLIYSSLSSFFFFGHLSCTSFQIYAATFILQNVECTLFIQCCCSGTILQLCRAGPVPYVDIKGSFYAYENTTVFVITGNYTLMHTYTCKMHNILMNNILMKIYDVIYTPFLLIDRLKIRRRLVP